MYDLRVTSEIDLFHEMDLFHFSPYNILSLRLTGAKLMP